MPVAARRDGIGLVELGGGGAVDGVAATELQPVSEVRSPADERVVDIDDLELRVARVHRRLGLPVLAGGQPPAALDPGEGGRRFAYTMRHEATASAVRQNSRHAAPVGSAADSGMKAEVSR